jgi:PERQ amino acid-rich with GYF domain-containing protein
MQKWYDGGYFTPDLPMKRTHSDTQWVTVEELVRRTGGGKIFLTNPPPSVPPGLSLRTESPNFGDHLFNGPYQPAPLRSLRSSTLDTYASPSDSPSSSIGGGRYGNNSPDPNAFGGRGAYFVGDTSHTSRVASFSSMPDAPAAFSGRRNAFNDSSLDPSLGMQSPGFGNMIPSRGSTGDSYGYHTYSSGQNTWGPTPNTAGAAFDVSGAGQASAVDPRSYSHFAPSPGVASTSYGNLQNSAQDNAYGEGIGYQSLNYNHFNGLGSGHGPVLGQYSNSPTTQYASPQIPQQSASLPSNAYEPQSNTQQGMPGDPQPHPLSNTTSAQSLWDNETYPSRRPGPFDSGHPTSSNTMVIQPSAVADRSPWGRSSPSDPHANDTSPWALANQGPADENWKETSGMDRLTFSNVGRHNEHQHKMTAIASHTRDVEQDLGQSQPLPETSELPIPISDTTTKAASTPTVHPKPQMTTKSAQLSTPKAAPSNPQVTTDSVPSPTQKPAWSKEDEATKPKPSGISVSLREIQEAEAKKAGARKATERERERAARASALTAETRGEGQPFTASWGLPTSQAGIRNNAPTAKDAKDASPSQSPATPVWTTPIKPPVTKKTMKEIQEEEEKRKKLAAKETVAAAAARRAYADSTTKVRPLILSIFASEAASRLRLRPHLLVARGL